MLRRCIRRSRCSRWWSCSSAARTATSSTRSSMRAWRSTWSRLDEDGQVDFKGKAKVFCRTYDFLSSVIPYSNAEWEKLSIFLEPADAQAAGAEGGGPRQGHPRSHRHGQLPRREEGGDEDRAGGQGRGDRAGADGRAAATSPSRRLDRLSNILKTFNEQFGTLFTDTDRVAKRIRDDIAPQGRRRRGLPEREGEHAAHRAHGARPGARRR